MPETAAASLVEKTEAFFGEDTPLQRAAQVGGRPYEPRPQQREMARQVARHLADGRHLCIEAPTGVGKTFAYLVPAIYFAAEREQPVVVSTHTLSLQEQVLFKDIPVLRQLLDRDVRACLAKGRTNYICLRRLTAVTDLGQQFLPGDMDLSELEELATWAATTEDGSLTDLEFTPTGSIWEQVCCEPGNCLNAACPFFARCHLMRARRNLLTADVIVANHALFFSDLAMRLAADGDDEAAAVLPDYGAVVLDEGHTLEDCAASHMGLRISSVGLKRVLRRLYNADRGRGLLGDVHQTPARMAATAALEKAEAYLQRIVAWLEPQPDPLRYTVGGHIPDYLGPVLEGVEREVMTLAKAEPDDSRRQELRAVTDQLHDLRTGMSTFLDMGLADHVYWFERFGAGGREVTMNAVPMDLGPVLQTALFSRPTPVVVTSATLAVRGRMDYFQRRIGAVDVDPVVLDSPFDFRTQVSLYVASSMPSPKDYARFLPAACRQVERFIQLTSGRAFVLFTSYSMLRDMAAEMTGFFEDADIQLLVQGEGMPRSRMLEEFRRDVNSVIFGTTSFWMGVDVPGEALSNVIIVRLPFAVPDHPLVAARQEVIEAQGGKAFSDYALPEAILRFRQGFGRLIRSREDRGIIVVLDSRIVRTGYGRAFLDSIPECTVEIF